MMKKYVGEPLVLFLLVAFAMTGCSGGSGGDSGGSAPVTNPSLQVLPVSFDFGKVTTNNSPSPLVVTIKNNGSAALVVSNTSVSDQNNFSLNSNGGSNPCASISPTIPAAGSCTFEVKFQPTTDGIYSANIQINSNDGSSPVFLIPLHGTSEPVESLTVRINQLETSCPSDEVTAFVSVTDQGNYPVLGLLDSNFKVTEGSSDLAFTSTFVNVAYETISIAAVMDFSSSITSQPVAIADMKNGLINLFNGLRSTDLGEIIKFNIDLKVVQPFTSDKAALTAAISAAFDNQEGTRLFDAASKAVDDTALEVTKRKAVIVITDGKDDRSTLDLSGVINNATGKGVPIFTIGIGNSIDTNVLVDMASGTGGQFFEANTSQNLATIYQQLSSVLFVNQYILTFNQQEMGPGNTANLSVQATNSQSISGSDTNIITSCN